MSTLLMFHLVVSAVIWAVSKPEYALGYLYGAIGCFIFMNIDKLPPL